MNHDNDYHDDVNYGNRFADDWYMNKPDLPPILNTKEYKSLVEKYKQEEEKQQTYCYKPYRTLHNY